jgi:uncharacterized membrane protein
MTAVTFKPSMIIESGHTVKFERILDGMYNFTMISQLVVVVVVVVIIFECASGHGYAVHESFANQAKKRFYVTLDCK